MKNKITAAAPPLSCFSFSNLYNVTQNCRILNLNFLCARGNARFTFLMSLHMYTRTKRPVLSNVFTFFLDRYTVYEYDGPGYIHEEGIQ